MNRPVIWNVYIVRCNDGTLYTGITTDVLRRVSEHNGGEQAGIHEGGVRADGVRADGTRGKGVRGNGAAYTCARRPVRLVYQETADSRSSASKREWSLKRLTRAAKLQLTHQWLAKQ